MTIGIGLDRLNLFGGDPSLGDPDNSYWIPTRRNSANFALAEAILTLQFAVPLISCFALMFGPIARELSPSDTRSVCPGIASPLYHPFQSLSLPSKLFT